MAHPPRLLFSSFFETFGSGRLRPAVFVRPFAPGRFRAAARERQPRPAARRSRPRGRLNHAPAASPRRRPRRPPGVLTPRTRPPICGPALALSPSECQAFSTE
ncbi:hypothetical protein A33M_3132 [Rhodovulum sp. PH10]|nr:hypothetical protein A33M_3132 [Rhodovulum sp. PH10]